MRPSGLCAVLAVGVLLGPVGAVDVPVLFRDITREAGVTFEHHAAPEKKYIVESI